MAFVGAFECLRSSLDSPCIWDLVSIKVLNRRGARRVKQGPPASGPA